MANWVKYISRSFEQLQQDLLDSITNRLPEFKHSPNNLFVRLLGTISGIAEMLGYYIDNAARELYPATARRKDSLLRIAKLLDVRIPRARPAEVRVEITLKSTSVPASFSRQPIKILIDETPYTSDPISLNLTSSQNRAFVDFVQFERKTVQIDNVTLSATNRDIPLNVKAISGSMSCVNFTSPQNEVVYSEVETFAFSGPNDAHFTTSIDVNDNVVATFGDGLYGVVPTSTSFRFTYNETLGAAANTISLDHDVEFDGIQTLEDNTNAVIRSIFLGSDVLTVEQIRTYLHLHGHTTNRVFTLRDFERVAVQDDLVLHAKAVLKRANFVDVWIAVDLALLLPSNRTDILREAEKRIGRVYAANILLGVEYAVRQVSLVEFDLNLSVTYNAQVVAEPKINQLVVDALRALVQNDNNTIRSTLTLGEIYQYVNNIDGISESLINSVSYPKPNAVPLEASFGELNARISLQGASVETTNKRIRIDWVDNTYDIHILNELDEITETVRADIPPGTSITVSKASMYIVLPDASNSPDVDTGRWKVVRYPETTNVSLEEYGVFVLGTLTLQTQVDS